MTQLIETQFPIARLSAESYKERKSGAGQTLTSLGKWWGRKPLILVRAAIVGMLMPASADAKKDREIFLKILTMDNDGAWQRCKGDVPAAVWREAASTELKEEYFTARGFQRGLSDEQKEAVCLQIWDSLDSSAKRSLDSQRRRVISDRETFDALPYAERIGYCDRPENVDGPSVHVWQEINGHLGTDAANIAELVDRLGQQLFGHRPRIGDSFCGGGSIPFEAARIGCDAFGSDLNPVASLLTWASINLLGGDQELQRDVHHVQEKVFTLTNRQVIEWKIEQNELGERADAYLYCVEVKPESCEYYIPLAPSWIVAEKTRTVVTWHRVDGSDRLRPEVVEVSDEELKKFKDKKGATVVNSRVVDPFDPSRSWSIESLRGPNGLRLWANDDLIPHPEDVFQDRLYCIRWVSIDGARRYAAPDTNDLKREEKVLQLLLERFANWQQAGYLPSKRIASGYNTDQPTRERGWTYWHHLFTPRQLLTYGAYLSFIPKSSNAASVVNVLLKVATQTNWNSKLNVWNANLGKGGGAGYSEQTFANQALNTLFNYGTRSFICLSDSLRKELNSVDLPATTTTVLPTDARDVTEICDIWITDPPYADAINYHELADFFLAWYDKPLIQAFPTWVPDSRSELAVKGDGDDFRRSMVDVYRNLAQHMPDNGMQMVMFTHQDPGVWADLGMVLWAGGLKATAAWTISTGNSRWT